MLLTELQIRAILLWRIQDPPIQPLFLYAARAA